MSSKAERTPTRYSVHTEARERIIEIGIGTNREEQEEFARRHNARTGDKTWVWNVRTGETLLMLKRQPRVHRAGGGQ